VTFDLSSDMLPQSTDSNSNTAIEFDPDSLLSLEEEPGTSSSPPPGNNDIFFNENGQQVQRFVLDGVEILLPLPSSSSASAVTEEDILPCDSENPLEQDPSVPISGRKRRYAPILPFCSSEFCFRCLGLPIASSTKTIAAENSTPRSTQRCLR
jgi:hypothetical protein